MYIYIQINEVFLTKPQTYLGDSDFMNDEFLNHYPVHKEANFSFLH